MLQILLISLALFAENPPPAATPSPAVETPKMTKREAKDECRKEGKVGKDLIACVKEKTAEK